MNKLQLAIAFLFLTASFALAEEVEVYDYETGQAKFHNVQRFGDTATVYDCEQKKCCEVTQTDKHTASSFGYEKKTPDIDKVLPDFSSIVNTDRDYQISHAVKP
jgi:hypothetical protein